jgi:hypothetical protein
MSAEVELISTMGEKKSWNRPPIQMEFQVILLLPIEGKLNCMDLGSNSLIWTLTLD